MDEIRVETQRDEASQALKEVILRGWPDDKKSLPSQVLPYYSVRDKLTIEHDLIFKGERVVIPMSLRKANGKVEAAVKMAKQLLRKAQDSNADIQLSLLDQRNTPKQGMNTSSAQTFLNRRTKTLLPTKDTLLRPEVPRVKEQREKIKKKQKDQARYYNRKAKDLPKLMKGDVAQIKPTKNSLREWRKGVVVRRIDDRSYVVETVGSFNLSYPKQRRHNDDESHLRIWRTFTGVIHNSMRLGRYSRTVVDTVGNTQLQNGEDVTICTYVNSKVNISL